MVLHLARRAASIAALALLMVTLALPAHAVTLLRDADLEYGLKQIATPVLRAAGLSPTRVKILIVDDGTLNAFVVSQDAIFIHSGLIGKLTSARQLQSVIAHEAAHIVNGHLTRRLTNLRAARTAAGLGVALAAVAGAASGNGGAAAGIALGAQNSAMRSFFRHTRAEESSADQSAISFLRSAGIGTQGMVEVMQIFRGQEVLAEHRQDPYARTHPLSRDRLRAINAAVSQDKELPDDKTAAYFFARVKGKLTAWQRAPKWTLRRAKESGYADVRAIREAVAYHRQSQTKKALKAVDSALAPSPNDPFLHDLKGEILMDSRNFSASAASYARAVQLAPRDALVLSGYGRALLASGQPKAALGYLERARGIDYRDGHMLRDLATTYAKLGQTGMAALVTAERYALRGRLDDAGIHAQRASDLLPVGSGPWQRAQDVLSAAKRHSKKRKR
ncbi:peptidase M48 [Aliishimia ponticola]|uniref:Peptidase M48 n=1 Tax=Aliishimia ponticola TaxID=2499833 RepID=A0A4S4NH12_9RHOB|nr:M48 family metalloprotease [Aliishimia ponticola]THH38952.1 peptidase M48 [Aliishimia ponticola]